MKTTVSLKGKLSSGIVYAPVPQLGSVNWLTWPDSSSLPVYDPSKMPLYQVRPTGASRQGQAVAQLSGYHSHAQQVQRGSQEAVGTEQYCLCVTWLPRKWKNNLYIQSTDICGIGASPTSGSEVCLVTWVIVSASSFITSILLHHKSNLSPTPEELLVHYPPRLVCPGGF